MSKFWNVTAAVIGIVTGLLTLVVILFPATGELLGSPAARPWVACVLGIGSTLLLSRWYWKRRLNTVSEAASTRIDIAVEKERRRNTAKLAELRSKHNDTKRKRELTADVAVIKERIDGWELNSDFHWFWVHVADFKYMHMERAHALTVQLRRWTSDHRRINDPHLRQRFDALRDATQELRSVLAHDMVQTDVRGMLKMRPAVEDEVQAAIYTRLTDRQGKFNASLGLLHSALHAAETEVS